MRTIIITVLLVAGALAVTCPPCDATACEETTCGSSDPYYCDAGFGKGGCATNPNAWNDTKVCFSCCNVDLCKPRFSCAGQCPPEVCHAANRCPLASQYECTAGKYTNGCSSNASYWPFQHYCTACCDVTTCEFQCGTCTPAQCAAGSCTSKDRFQCTGGPMANNCSVSPTYFGQQSQCSSCCDTNTCSAPFTCNKQCSVAVCHSVNRCPIVSPYQCTSGSATFGCSTNASFWPFDHQCADCCDVTQCEFTCPPCTPAQCSTNPCTPVAPYVCTAGGLVNGCSPDPSYFGQQSQCFSCCDSSACPSSNSGSQ